MAMINVSSKYKDIISKSSLISSGSPDVYQLRLKEDKIGTLTRKTVGEKNLNKENKTILLVGETGTGKSTLINALVNYTMGVKFEDNIWFEIVEDEKRSQSESQTSDVIVYQIFGFEDKTLPFSLTIINTPGFGDTSGSELDDIISQRLFDLFSSDDGVQELDAVGLVLKASLNRVSDQLKNIFDSVTSLFGKDIEKNIVALITNSNGITPDDALKALEAANIKCAKNEKNQPVHFLFDNCQKKQRIEEDELALENTWRVTERGMNRFTDFLEKSRSQMLKTTIEVLNARIRMTACVQNLQERIELVELKQNEIQQTQEALEEHEQEMKNNEKFTVEVDEVYKEKETVDGGKWGLFFYKGAVTCNICEVNCHYPCTMAQSPEHCEVIKKGCCTVCTKRCSASEHVKENWKYVNKTRKVKKTMEELKQKYEVEQQENNDLLLSLEREKEKLNKEKNNWLDKVYQHVVTLEEIALNVNSLSTHVHLDSLIEKMKERRDTEKVKKLEEMKHRGDEGAVSDTVQHMFDTKTPVSSSLCGVSLTDSNMATLNVSSKYKDIISKSLLISSGSPAVYQLRPKAEKFGTLTRKTVGEKNLNKKKKTILLVGETGTGKSTLINALVNYAMGVKFEDNIWFEIIEREQRSQAESQTSDVIVYEIFGFEGKTLPFSLTIIDTPGYGDTRGIEHDIIISQRLFDLFRSDDGVQELDAVGLVLKASENRLNDRQKYVFDSVTSLFGKDIEKNVVALITNANGMTPDDALKALEAANIKCAKNEKNQPVHFMFNNCQKKQRTEEEQNASVFAWGVTETGMKQFKDFLEDARPQMLIIAVEVLNARIRLIACIQNLQERIQLIELKQGVIKQTEEALKIHEEEMKNEKFTVEVDEVYKEREEINSEWWGAFKFLWLDVPAPFYVGAVTCNKCEENCHYPGCTISPSPSLCEVMRGGHCTVCTKRCSASDHVKLNFKYVNKTKTVKKTIEELKQKYEVEQQENKDVLMSLKREKEKLDKEKNDWLDEACQHVVRLEEIALNVNSLSTYVHLDSLIKKLKERGDTEKIKKLEEVKSRVNEGSVSDTLRYMFDKLTAGKAV